MDGAGATVEVEEMVADALGSGTAWDVASAFGGLKGGRGDWLVEKCAELGARTLVPLLTTRSGAIGGGDRDGDKKRSGSRRASGGDDDGSTASGREGRWGRVAHAASKQSLRVYGLTRCAADRCRGALRRNRERLWRAVDVARGGGRAAHRRRRARFGTRLALGTDRHRARGRFHGRGVEGDDRGGRTAGWFRVVAFTRGDGGDFRARRRVGARRGKRCVKQLSLEI